MAAEKYEFPPIPSQDELDNHDVPFVHRDNCATPLIEYYKCLNKGTSFCSATKEEFFKCQYFALKERLANHQKQ